VLRLKLKAKTNQCEIDKYNIPGIKEFAYTKIIGGENIEFGNTISIDDFRFYLCEKADKVRKVYSDCLLSPSLAGRAL
jgi:hypothetical protein